MKLNKRQTIIIAITIVIIIVAVADRLFFSKKKSSLPKPSSKAESFNIADIAQSASQKVSPDTLYAIEIAKKPWQRNIFAAPDKKMTALKSSQKTFDASAEPEFKYSGLIDTGKKRIAIINGIEYAEGELLNEKDIYLKQIFTDRVVIENRPLRTQIEVSLDTSDKPISDAKSKQ